MGSRKAENEHGEHKKSHDYVQDIALHGESENREGDPRQWRRKQYQQSKLDDTAPTE
jgi:hypothetical protein